MFFVINKEKVYAYMVSVLTIIILFFMSNILNDNNKDLIDVTANIDEVKMEFNLTNNEFEAGIVEN